MEVLTVCKTAVQTEPLLTERLSVFYVCRLHFRFQFKFPVATTGDHRRLYRPTRANKKHEALSGIVSFRLVRKISLPMSCEEHRQRYNHNTVLEFVDSQN